VSYDPNTITPCGKTYGEIDADEARYVAAANDALASLRERGCRWWNYSVSHCTFELVIGDPLARYPNLVICLAACDHISGPVGWANQQLRVIWDNDRERNKPWVFTLRDDSVHFKAVGGVFGWRRNFDLHKHGSMYFDKPGGPSTDDEQDGDTSSSHGRAGPREP